MAPAHHIFEIYELKDLQTVLGQVGSKLVVVDFFATWCGPCKMIGPHFEEMRREMEDVAFFKVDVDRAEDAAEEYSVTAMPTFLFFKDGKKIDEMMGANVDKLKSLIQQHK